MTQSRHCSLVFFDEVHVHNYTINNILVLKLFGEIQRTRNIYELELYTFNFDSWCKKITVGLQNFVYFE